MRAKELKKAPATGGCDSMRKSCTLSIMPPPCKNLYASIKVMCIFLSDNVFMKVEAVMHWLSTHI
jgi:hypothetical protein